MRRVWTKGEHNKEEVRRNWRWDSTRSNVWGQSCRSYRRWLGVTSQHYMFFSLWTVIVIGVNGVDKGIGDKGIFEKYRIVNMIRQRCLRRRLFGSFDNGFERIICGTRSIEFVVIFGMDVIITWIKWPLWCQWSQGNSGAGWWHYLAEWHVWWKIDDGGCG